MTWLEKKLSKINIIKLLRSERKNRNQTDKNRNCFEVWLLVHRNFASCEFFLLISSWLSSCCCFFCGWTYPNFLSFRDTFSPQPNTTTKNNFIYILFSFLVCFISFSFHFFHFTTVSSLLLFFIFDFVIYFFFFIWICLFWVWLDCFVRNEISPVPTMQNFYVWIYSKEETNQEKH